MASSEDGEKNHAYCVVWTTLPLISVLLPTIGHVGISDSSGVMNDFAGPYFVGKGRFMCGPPRRVWKLDTTGLEKETYDEAVGHGASVYERRMHNIVMDNCHSHVACVLNKMRYEGRENWNMIRVWWAIWTRGRWVSSVVAWRTMLPSVVLATIIVLCSVLPTVLK